MIMLLINVKCEQWLVFHCDSFVCLNWILYFCFYFSPPINDYDVFNEGKTQSFFQSQNAVMTLCTYLEDINKKLKDPSENQLFEHFNKLLQVSNLNTSLLHDNQVSVFRVNNGFSNNVQCEPIAGYETVQISAVSFILYRIFTASIIAALSDLINIVIYNSNIQLFEL